MPTKKKESVVKGIKPTNVTYIEKLKDNSSFLLALIEDPVKAFRAYGFNGDEKMMNMMQGMSKNIRLKAIDSILKIGKSRDAFYTEKVKDDQKFLLELIDDPVKTFRSYGFNGDDKMMVKMQSASKEIRIRAIKVFSEVIGLAAAGQACDACNGCRACKACSDITTDMGTIRR
jgi:hypothetical protein